ncbi:MAG: histidine kinase [Bacteroidota bacterium]
MRLSLFLLLCFCLWVTSDGYGQSVSKKRKRTVFTLEQAENLREKDPAEAIRVLNAVIQQKKRAGELAEAFLLLGDIYTDIGQEDLALGRYERALEVQPEKDRAGQANIYGRRGGVLLSLGKADLARADFTRCLSLAPKGSEQWIACQEGLADVEAATNNLAQSQTYYEEVQSIRPADSLLQTRVSTKRADVYLQQNDLEAATNSLEEAVSTVPQGQPLPRKETKQLLATNARVRGSVLKEAPALDRAITTKLPTGKIPLLATDNFARFRALRDIGRTGAATESLENALAGIDSTTAPAITTEIYSEGANFYLDNRQPARAAAIYRSYTAANDRLLAEQRQELALQADILREQQAVDLGLKDLAAAETEGRLLEEQVSLQRWLIYLLGALLFGALLSVLLILRNVRKRRRANQELLLRNLQTRMNPHFIFNSLNSINNYIARQDERSANRYLGRFAKLMRNVLDQSGKDFVPLSEELAQLALYLELEQERFAGKFTYRIEENAAVDTEAIRLPPMILQPFAENAIWHGLRYRPDGGELLVEVVPGAVRIVDNGIGRIRSAELKTANQRKHRSTGMATTRQRLALINAHYRKDYRVAVSDAGKGEYPGTLVTISF